MSEKEIMQLLARGLLYARAKHWLIESRLPWLELEDIVYSSLEDMLAGVRRCPSNIPHFMCLCKVIDSKVSHLWREANRRVNPESVEEELPELFERLQEEFYKTFPHFRPTVEATDQQAIDNEFKQNILTHVRAYSDPVLLRVAECLLTNNRITVRETAEILSISEKEVRKAQLKLQKIFMEVRING